MLTGKPKIVAHICSSVLEMHRQAEISRLRPCWSVYSESERKRTNKIARLVKCKNEDLSSIPRTYVKRSHVCVVVSSCNLSYGDTETSRSLVLAGQLVGLS